MEFRTKVPIHIQASEELALIEKQRPTRVKPLNKINRKPNPFASSVFPSNAKFTGTKVIDGDTKTQFRIRPQTPKLDMILLQKAKRKQLRKLDAKPVRKAVIEKKAPQAQKKKIKI